MSQSDVLLREHTCYCLFTFESLAIWARFISGRGTRFLSRAYINDITSWFITSGFRFPSIILGQNSQWESVTDLSEVQKSSLTEVRQSWGFPSGGGKWVTEFRVWLQWIVMWRREWQCHKRLIGWLKSVVCSHSSNVCAEWGTTRFHCPKIGW